MLRSILSIIVSLELLIGSVAAAEVDTRLVGTWHLEGVASDVYWVIRADGFYRLHSRHQGVSHRGTFSANGSTWSLNSPQWQDSGSYELVDADTWSASGLLGTGTWRRVWHDQMPVADITGHKPAGTCELLTLGEVSLLLNSPVVAVEGIGSSRGGRNNGCRFRSKFAQSDTLEIYVYPNTINSRHSVMFTGGAVNVPTLGPSARAEATRGGLLNLEAELRGYIYVVNFRLEPVADGSDLPALTQIVQLAASRNLLR